MQPAVSEISTCPGCGRTLEETSGGELGCMVCLLRVGIDGEVEGTIDSTGTLTIGEHARIRGEIRTKSVKVRGRVEGNIFVTERCELQAGCTLRGDIEAPRLVVNETATFLGSAKVGTGKSLPA
jgi:cytoskeletal protein CcmA (bactofilin family)